MSSVRNKQPSGRGRRRRNRQRAQGLQRGNPLPVAVYESPKPYLSVRPYDSVGGEARGSNIFVVEGVETIGAFDRVTTGQKTVLAAQLQPENSQVFQRLSAVALAFEQYRFRSVQLCYHPATPTSSSGVVGMMIDLDPNDPQPPDFTSIANNEAGAVGSVAAPLSVSASFPSNEPYRFTARYGQGSSDARWEGAGRLWVVTGQGVDQLIAGFLSIRYVIEFLRLRPVPQVVNAGGTVAQTFTGGAATSKNSITYSPHSIVGYFGAVGTHVTDIYDGGLGADQLFHVSAGPWIMGFTFSLGASSVDKLKSKCAVTEPGWFSVHDEKKGEPATAGDVTINVNFIAYSDTQTTVIVATNTVSLGTGALAGTEFYTFTITEPGYLFVTIVPTGVENRVMTNGTYALVNNDTTAQ